MSIDFSKLLSEERGKYSTNPDYDKKVPEEVEKYAADLGIDRVFKPLDRFGTCPSCAANWDGGDIAEHLYKMDIFMNKSIGDVKKLAESAYGYTDENKKRFSNLIAIRFVDNSIHEAIGPATVNVTDVHYFQCGNCRKVWDANTGELFSNILLAKARHKQNLLDNEHNSGEPTKENQVQTTGELGHE